MECGGAAAAMGGVSNTAFLFAALDRIKPSVPLILALDNDEAGRTAAKKLSEGLSERGIAYINGAELSGKYHDPNDRLINDPEGLKRAVRELWKPVRPYIPPLPF